MCVAPLALPDANKVYRSVKCGRCVECINQHIADWIFRFEQERKEHRTCIFLTLTYASQFLPYTVPREPYLRPACHDFYNLELRPPFIRRPTLDVKDLQDFWKRLRYFNKSDIKYYVVGEYGSKRGRPHYHAIVFGVDDEKFIEQAWSKGGIPIGRVDYPHVNHISGMAYIFKYINKSKSFENGRRKEFSCCSRGIGLSYLTDAMYRYYRSDVSNGFIISNGIKRSLPRYYKRKVYIDPEQIGLYNKLMADLVTKSHNDLIDKFYRRHPEQSRESIENYLDNLKIRRTFTVLEKQVKLKHSIYEIQ